MARVLTNENNYYDIADTIRQMKNVNTTYKPRQMASALKDIYSNEVEGTLPLSFQANGNNLLDYRIDGASGGVGDRTKNLLQNTATSQTINGVTFTVNNDGSVTCNGTSSATTTFAISITLNSNINYVLSGSPKNGSIETYRLDLRNISYSVYNNTADNGNGINFTVEENGTYLVCIRIAANYTCNNLTFYPMIRLATIEDDTYEPYGYKVPVVISGKNLVNKNNMLQGYWAYANGDFANVNTWICTPKIECSGDTPYTYQFSNTSRWSGFVFYDENGNYISTSNKQDISSTPYRTYTATSPSNARYLIVNIAGFPGTADTISVSDLINFQLEKNSTPTDYEPYHEPTTTNIYLDEPIEENESISLSETNVDIPTIEGTNVITIDTTVQPSNVYIQAPKDSLEATQIASELEEI